MDRQIVLRSLEKLCLGAQSRAFLPVQYRVLNALLERGRDLTNAELAYVMATAWYEARFIPRRENLSYTTPERLMAVWPTRFASTEAARPFLHNPRKLANLVYDGRLGNRPGSDDGYRFRGGGLSQLTGRDNYRKAARAVGADLVARPEVLSDPVAAVDELVEGMRSGRYRGHRLSTYFHAGRADFEGARAIVNADLARSAKPVADQARAMFEVLRDAGRKEPSPTRPPRRLGLAQWLGGLVRVMGVAR